MTDKELLELAAKAAEMDTFGFAGLCEPWNPLTDDGDALRLAVKLGLDVARGFDTVEVTKYDFDKRKFLFMSKCEDVNNDPYAATRRAIVRAAAEIGRQS